MKRFHIISVLGILLVASLALAAVPKLINFQGILKDGSGNPVANASYSVTFTIYDAAAGGNNLWTETQSVTTTSGLFTVLLGAANPVPDSAFKDTTRYLGVKVGADPEMTPRQQLVSVAYGFRISSVDGAAGGTITSKVSIGPGHINTGTNAFVAGANNRARGNYSVVSGGGGATAFDSNSAIGDNSAIGGGMRNTASGQLATVGGGNVNTASVIGATVGGGIQNTASGLQSTVGGGLSNTASGAVATVAGGLFNKARGEFSVVSGGGGATVADSNSALGDWSVVGGGLRNTASGISATVDGGQYNTASAQRAAVGGGRNNIASGDDATVGGGGVNTASGVLATVGGGQQNTASSAAATVGGGFQNTASGNSATVSGGSYDTASGVGATVPGGNNNTAAGDYSFAAGVLAKANHHGTFVWADYTFANFASTAANQFLIRASGGVGIGTNSPTAQLDVNGSVAVGSGTPILKVLSASASLNFPSTASLAFSDLTLTVTGAADGDMVAIGVPNGAVTAGAIYTAWISAANTVTIRFNNLSAGAVNPAAGTFRAAIMQF